MPDMIIKINVFNSNGSSMGKTSIWLDWKPQESSAGPLINEWGIWDFNYLSSELLWDEYSGIFDIKTWDVMWLWAQDESHHHWRHVFILRDPPTSRYDDSHISGVGRVYKASNATYSGMTLKWKVKCLAGCYIS